MLNYKRNTLGIKEKAELEAARCDLEKQKADLGYIAMMTDVELDEEEMIDE